MIYYRTNLAIIGYTHHLIKIVLFISLSHTIILYMILIIYLKTIHINNQNFLKLLSLFI